MKQAIINLFLTLIFGNLLFTEVYSQTNDWKMHTEKINDKFVIQFKHPSNTVFEHIQNGLCIGEADLQNMNLENFIASQDWCIWLEDSSNYSIREEVAYFNENLAENTTNHTDTIIVDGCKATRLKTSDVVTGEVLSEKVFYTKYSTLFSIYLDSQKLEEFQRFIMTIETKRI